MLEYSLLSLILGLLLLVAWQDISRRLISLWLVLVLAGSVIIWGVTVIGLNQWLKVATCNLLIIGLQWVGLKIFYRFKEGGWYAITDRLIGKGDWAILIIACGAFSPVQFVFFYVSGLVIALSIAIFIKPLRQTVSIPLAGILSLWAISCLAVMALSGKHIFFGDELLMRYLIMP